MRSALFLPANRHDAGARLPVVAAKLRLVRHALEKVLGLDLVPLRRSPHDLRQHHTGAAVLERSDRDDLLALLGADAGQGKLVLRAVS